MLNFIVDGGRRKAGLMGNEAEGMTGVIEGFNFQTEGPTDTAVISFFFHAVLLF